jgi:hypothetical protein
LTTLWLSFKSVDTDWRRNTFISDSVINLLSSFFFFLSLFLNIQLKKTFGRKWPHLFPLSQNYNANARLLWKSIQNQIKLRLSFSRWERESERERKEERKKENVDCWLLWEMVLDPELRIVEKERERLFDLIFPRII